MDKNKKSVLIGTLDYMQRIDPNGTWEDVAEDIAHGEIVEKHDITYTIETLKDWAGELEDGDRMKKTMEQWIERLKIINE
ncbi:hypothetical protein ABE073_04155 [Lederbergia citrisecunda]|uniref:hypothetical protein n=1 Tax=Lederbergia citrisecunda TaxID=2833583 RepID=UPI003D2C4C99